MQYGLCDFDLRFFGLVDMGRTRTSNQDEILLCPESGFFAVSDGMGGLRDGGKTSQMIKKVLPVMIQEALVELTARKSIAFAEELLKERAALLSDNIFETGNEGHAIEYGATLCGAWLYGSQALIVNVGDSRAYRLDGRTGELSQISKDHNIAALLVESGDLTREEAKRHPTSCRVTRFMGMPRPALPDVFCTDVLPGDRLILCSDGLHGMLEDEEIREILRKKRAPEDACRAFIDAANEAGGQDNISVVIVEILKNSLANAAARKVKAFSAVLRLKRKPAEVTIRKDSIDDATDQKGESGNNELA